MADKRLTRTPGNDISRKGNAGDSRGEDSVIQDPHAAPRRTSGEVPKPEIDIRRTRNDKEDQGDKDELLPQAVAFFLIEMHLGLRKIVKLNEGAYAEFERITGDEVGACELLDLHASLELLPRELQTLGQTAQSIVGRFRNFLLDSGVDASELEQRTTKKQQNWQSDDTDRLKESVKKLSENEMAIRTQIMNAFTALCKLREILKSVRNDHGRFARIDELALALIQEIDKIMKNLDGGELWKILRAQPPK